MRDHIELYNDEQNVCTFYENDLENACSFSHNDTCGDYCCTIQGKYLKILDLREGNEESFEETTGFKASVYKGFDDCTRIGNFVEILRFRHSTRVTQFNRNSKKSYKKTISDGINVSVVLDVE